MFLGVPTHLAVGFAVLCTGIPLLPVSAGNFASARDIGGFRFVGMQATRSGEVDRSITSTDPSVCVTEFICSTG